jgi:clan AA aspartic protease (TIGR02281 family)
MGLQDRNYWKERHKKQANSVAWAKNSSGMDLKDRYYWTKYKQIMNEDAQSGVLVSASRKRKVPFYFFLAISLFIYFSVFSLDKLKEFLATTDKAIQRPLESFSDHRQPKKPLERPVDHQPLKLPVTSTAPSYSKVPAPLSQLPISVVLHADLYGHYRGTVSINNIAMPFLIDTGATQTVVPTKMAYAARLPLGKAFQVSTANGLSVNRLTHINHLKIGNVSIKGLEASTTDHLEEVLIGMNTLKYFHMTQDGNTLTLTLYPEIAKEMASIPEISPSTHQVKKTWKKTVTCDIQGRCKTSYNN